MTTMTTLTDEQLARMAGSIDVMSEARCREVLALLLVEVRAARAAPPPDLAEIEGLRDRALCGMPHGSSHEKAIKALYRAAVRRLAGSAPATGMGDPPPDFVEGYRTGLETAAAVADRHTTADAVATELRKVLASIADPFPEVSPPPTATGTGDAVLAPVLERIRSALAGLDVSVGRTPEHAARAVEVVTARLRAPAVWTAYCAANAASPDARFTKRTCRECGRAVGHTFECSHNTAPASMRSGALAAPSDAREHASDHNGSNEEG